MSLILIYFISIIFVLLQETDAELGQTGAAGLASVETLDDGNAEKNPISNEDGMETVRLDGFDDAADNIEPPKHPLITCISAIRRHIVISGTQEYIMMFL